MIGRLAELLIGNPTPDDLCRSRRRPITSRGQKIGATVIRYPGEAAAMDTERTSASGSSRSSGSRSAGLLLESLAALAVLAVLAALMGACTTAAPAPGTAEAVDRAASNASLAATHIERGDALYDQGKLEESIVEYREAARLDSTNAHLWMRLGQVYEQTGRGEDALHSLEKGLEADPGNAGILNQMGWLYATAEPATLRDPAKALAYAQRAVEASGGGDANILDTLAEAYYANRQFDEAIEIEERALEIAPESEALQSQLVKFREAKAAASGR
jgi:tetratricopeptide (TPR) repeat protein